MTKELDHNQADADWKKFVQPLLIQHGWQPGVVALMLNRIEWGADHANWTIRLNDMIPTEVPDIERNVRAAQQGVIIPHMFIVQAYLTARGRGPVMSYGVIGVHNLARLTVATGPGCYDRENPAEPGIMFRCLMFGQARQLLGENQVGIFK